MALYRCAACGSPNVVMDKQTAGIKYDYVKGVIGTVILGAGGATAGITNQTQTVYKCPDCGITLTYPMPPEFQAIIDVGVLDADAREKITYQGMPFPWEAFVAKYKNVESGPADEEIKRRKAKEEKRKADEVAYVEELAEVILKGAKKPAPIAADVDKLQQAWELLNKDKLDARNAAIEAATAEIESKVVEYVKKESAKCDDLMSKIQSLQQEIEDLRLQRQKAGIFKASLKKELDQKITAANEKLAKASNEVQEIVGNIEKLGKPSEYIRKKQLKAITQINADFCIPTSPMEAFNRQQDWDKKKMAYKVAGDIEGNREQYNNMVFYCLMSIAEYADGLTDMQYATLIQKCYGYDIAQIRVGHALRLLTDQGIMQREVCDGNTLYSAQK